ncbi:hypothetical protein B0H66DRAFT_124913 [Apodospora peruviana]|uniref:MICOS complex subunit MIC12 n=1 Tax=Apodospora peruviana TaxID=516989 RepID=A0AAE0II82_9PEZI|nr:hypothetical protein B0H66DRAFT_124913 [Apodospora peruviana]
MGFLAGFTGGVTLTLGVTYLAIAAHQRNRQTQADVLRAQTRVVNALAHDPSTRSPRLGDVTFPPSRVELAAQHRAHFVETAKDKWNSEIEGAVRWAQTKDWTEVRETAEDAAAVLLGVAKESNAAKQAGEVRDEMVDNAKGAAKEARAKVVETRNQVAAADIKSTLAETRDQVVEKAGEVKEESKGVLVRAVEKGRHMVGRAKAAVYLAEEKIETKMDAKIMHASDVEKALAERFEQPREDVMGKSVEQVLEERYTPIDKRDNTRLRGI